MNQFMRAQRPAVIDKAIVKIRSERGLPVRIAQTCGIARTAVYEWTRVPIERVHVVADIIGMTPEQIRPDIFRPKQRR
jgi:hypothetical protein